MSSTADVPLSIGVRLHRPAELTVTAPLARALIGGGKRTGLRKLRLKAVRSLFTLIHQRCGLPARAVMKSANGAAFAVDCAETAFLEYAARLRREEGFEPEVSGLLGHLAPRLRTVYDVGANWGHYPLLLGTDPRFSGEVHAFEIRPQTVVSLRRIVIASGLERTVKVHGYGLSEGDGEVRLSRGRHSYLSRVVAADYRGPTERVRVRRLDDLGLPAPDLIKIDVEGHEAAVLRGAAAVLDRDRPLIVFESWHRPAQVATMLEPLQLLAGHGYRLYRLGWRPGHFGTPSQTGTIELAPLAVAGRSAIAMTLNLLAVHSSRSGDLG